MPIYEFACPRCRVIVSFLVRAAGTDRTPSCPHCGGSELERVMSRFAVKKSGKSRAPAGDADGGGRGEEPMTAEDRRLERLMGEMSADIDKIDENDPRQIGRLLRKFGEASGEDLGPEFGEAVRRLEAGEDPEKIEEEMAGLFGEEGDEHGGGGGAYRRDDTLYEM